jgi:parallel beta-helix repeat protein
LLDLIEHLFTNYIYGVNQYYYWERRLMKRMVSGTLLVLLAMSLFAFTLNVRPSRAWVGGTITIKADGSIDPPSAPIIRVEDVYTLTENITTDVSGNDGIVIDRSGITLDGANHEIHAWSPYIWASGVLAMHGSVILKNLIINRFYTGIYLESECSNSSVNGNLIIDCTNGVTIYSGSYNSIGGNQLNDNHWCGVCLGLASHNYVFENGVRSNTAFGIVLNMSSFNNIIGNVVQDSSTGIRLDYSSNNTVLGNHLTGNSEAIFLTGSSFCSIKGNDIVSNTDEGIALCLGSTGNRIYENTVFANGDNGIGFNSASDNTVYHNNFINNTLQVYTYSSTNVWDDGYPSGGNYWSNYTGADHFQGANQDILGSDGIGDTRQIIDESNRDNYPLMGQFGGPIMKGLNVTVFPVPGVCLIFDNVTGTGSAIVNLTTSGLPPLPDYVLVGPYYDIKVSATYSGNMIVRIIYNDTGLTLEQEMSLQLRQWNASGDVNYDGKVDLKDVFAVGRAFGSVLVDGTFWHEPHRSCCPHSANTDLNGDGKVDLKDYFKTCKQYGKAAAWVDITTYVDTENNVIYGETDHFSSIGIHRPM